MRPPFALEPSPRLAPGCGCRHPVGSSPDRRVVAVGLVLVGAPFVIGAIWSVMIAEEALGPLITSIVWTALLVARVARSRAINFIEWFAVIGGLVMLQLLLDLRMPYLGDIVVAVLHAVFGLALLAGAWRDRRARRRNDTRPAGADLVMGKQPRGPAGS